MGYALGLKTEPLPCFTFFIVPLTVKTFLKIHVYYLNRTSIVHHYGLWGLSGENPEMNLTAFFHAYAVISPTEKVPFYLGSHTERKKAQKGSVQCLLSPWSSAKTIFLRLDGGSDFTSKGHRVDVSQLSKGRLENFLSWRFIF
jgi:hypothetical protein